MASLEDFQPGSRWTGLAATGPAEVVSITRFGPDAVNVVYRKDGRVSERLVYREEMGDLRLEAGGRAFGFDADGALLKLASEALRIRLAHLFDPYLAVNSSQIEALPHQITAVYGDMLARQPLRFLLADDPGAGKTIMAGLLIKELMIRGDLERCLIVAPGSLVEQWQDELSEKFNLTFDLLTREQIESSVTGNPFLERKRLIARLDMMSRSEDLQAKLEVAPEWDLVISDEAHRMSASFFGNEVKETKRYKLGKLLGARTRNLLLMSATPHNGKEADFQLFMGLLDGDRFEGRFREGVHKADVSDIMRRLTKEELYRFDGTKLFPPRRAYTASYELSGAEAALYVAVTNYVREEMNKADRGDDPPYYDNIAYADIADFFYVWLTRSARSMWPSLLSSMTTPKQQELTALKYRHGGAAAAEEHFIGGMKTALHNLIGSSRPDGVATIYYAFRQTESDDSGVTSRGWASFLQAMLEAGLSIDGTWPIRTELGSALKTEINSLASSIVLVSRERTASPQTIDRAELVVALRREMPDAIAKIRAAGVSPVDMQQAVVGPGMGVFTRYAQVLEDDDSPMPIRTALAIINRVWEELDSELVGSLDPETQVALAWFGSYGFEAKVRLTLEIEADAAAGFADADVGVVRDNAKQLKFRAESTGFE